MVRSIAARRFPYLLMTPHARWSIHSTYKTSPILLRLQRGKPYKVDGTGGVFLVGQGFNVETGENVDDRSGSPLFFTLLPPREYPLAYPPYFPPWIQQFGRWMGAQELVMSDMPWAMAWYGRRQSVWTTLSVHDPKGKDDFFTVNDTHKPVRALYLTTLSMDARFYSQMLRGQDWAWGKLVMDSLVTTNGLPPGFPLKFSPLGPYLSSGHFFLTDWPRWKGYADQRR